jgi:hypothetical protein
MLDNAVDSAQNRLRFTKLFFARRRQKDAFISGVARIPAALNHPLPFQLFNGFCHKCFVFANRFGGLLLAAPVVTRKKHKHMKIRAANRAARFMKAPVAQAAQVPGRGRNLSAY